MRARLQAAGQPQRRHAAQCAPGASSGELQFDLLLSHGRHVIRHHRVEPGKVALMLAIHRATPSRF
jgi:hypothetical protein